MREDVVGAATLVEVAVREGAMVGIAGVEVAALEVAGAKKAPW
jgi:hypothetical protein